MFKKDKVEISDFEKELRRRKRKEAITNGWNKVVDGVRENKDVLMFVVPPALAVIGGVTKVASKGIANHTANKEIRFKERHIYDHSQGRYVSLKRPMNTMEGLEFERRKEKGEGTNSILFDMGLLK